MFRLLAAVAPLLLLSACASLAPPPMVLGHGGPRAAPAGSTELLAGGMAGVGFVTEDLYAGGLRARHQLSETLALGAQFDAGGASGDDEHSPLGGSGRVYAHFHPGASDTRFAFGLGGGGASTGLAYGTIDASLFVGSGGDGFRVYGGPLVALSVPIEAGDEIHDEHPATSGYLALGGGFEVPFGEVIAWSFELALGGAANESDGAFLVGGATALRVRVPGS